MKFMMRKNWSILSPFLSPTILKLSAGYSKLMMSARVGESHPLNWKSWENISKMVYSPDYPTQWSKWLIFFSRNFLHVWIYVILNYSRAIKSTCRPSLDGEELLKQLLIRHCRKLSLHPSSLKLNQMAMLKLWELLIRLESMIFRQVLEWNNMIVACNGPKKSLPNINVLQIC